MSYQVLARKWRPRSFKELVGQSHVLQALVNALDQDRLHHAYLFTGTRGVGKTTIARILAKCLNCEVGVSSTPCGECGACREIDDGRFVDLIEVDAASRTKVEDTRELLDNVQYAPTRGRYKVYLIDEVHMLSAHSFNALLKTLEEPPPHVKFLLATTDPQKLPVTILSRCLQFGLKNMTPERIVGHLENILGQETIPFEVPALWQLARGADGSMRDALSLTDQAIAFGNGQVNEAEVSAMLGTIDQGQVMKMVVALSTGDAADVLKAVSELAEHAPDYASVLDDMLSMMHRIAIAQAVPDAVDNSQGDREQVLELAANMLAEDVQLYYQVGLISKKDLPLAPDPRGGFEMAMLRMLAFRPEPVVVSQSGTQAREQRASEDAAIATECKSSTDAEPEPAHLSEPESGLPAPEPLVEKAEAQVKKTSGSLVSNVLKAALAAEPVKPSVPEVAEPQVTVDSVPVSEPENAQEPVPMAQGLTRHENPLPEDFSPSPMPEILADAAATSVSELASAVEPEPVAPVFQDKPPEIAPEIAPQMGYDSAPENHYEPPVVEACEYDDVEQGESVPLSAYEVYAAQARVINAADERVTKVAEEDIEPEPVPDLSERVSLSDLDQQSWVSVFRSLSIGGVSRSIASHCEYVGHSASRISLRLDSQRNTLYNETHRERVEKAVSDYFGQPLKLVVESGTIETETPAAWRERKMAERLQEARNSIFSDENVTALVERFSATVLDESIQPIGNVIK